MTADKSKSPSKDELLNELESIRDFLNDEESLAELIPTLTTVAETHSEEPDSAASDLEQEPETNASLSQPIENSEHDLAEESLDELDQYELDEHEQDIIELDAEVADDLPYSEDEEPKLAAQDVSETSQTQESLFDHDDDPAPPKATSDTSNKDSASRMPKARGENPFLPPHIRERLGRHKEIFDSIQSEVTPSRPVQEKTEVQGDLLSGFQTDDNLGADEVSVTDKTKTQVSDHDLLIDEIIAEYLPIIEAKLRLKLKQVTLKDTD